jgi:hypothetical protein
LPVFPLFFFSFFKKQKTKQKQEKGRKGMIFHVHVSQVQGFLRGVVVTRLGDSSSKVS